MDEKQNLKKDLHHARQRVFVVSIKKKGGDLHHARKRVRVESN